jgi:hypothetical protein
MGLSRREFAKSEGASEGAVRYALKQGRLVARADGTLDPSQLGRRWMRNLPAASKTRVKRQASTAQSAQTTHPPAQIPVDVMKYYGWDEPDFDQETTEALGVLLCLKADLRTDPESIGISLALHAASLLQREACRLGWREDPSGTENKDEALIGPSDGVEFSDFGVRLDIRLIRQLGRIVDLPIPDEPHDPINVNDPIVVANLMIYLASEIFEQDLKRRRREAGIVGPRDSVD